MLNQLFLPATSLMNKLRFNLKFTLIMLLFFLPLFILAFSYFTQVNRISNHTKNELQGVNALLLLDKHQQQLVSLIANDMAWRSGTTTPIEQTNLINSFNSELQKLANADYFNSDERLSLSASLKSITSNLSKITAELGNPQWTVIDRFEYLNQALNQFNTLYLKISNLKGLTNDPQVDTVVLSRLITEKRQLVLSLMTRSYAVASYALGENQVSSGTFDGLSNVNDDLFSNLVKIKNLSELNDCLLYTSDAADE